MIHRSTGSERISLSTARKCGRKCPKQERRRKKLYIMHKEEIKLDQIYINIL